MELICILDSINVPSYFEEEENILDFIETSLHLMDEYQNNSFIIEDMLDIWNEQLNIDDCIELEEEIEEWLDIVFELFNDINGLGEYVFKGDDERERADVCDREGTDVLKTEDIFNKIEELKRRNQPVQRTTEWYNFRNNLITASDAHKVFKSKATMNELIFKKCEQYQLINNGLDTKTIVINNGVNANQVNIVNVNVNSSLHWGQKYEPLSVMIYEMKNNTKIGEFGCMQHPRYSFLGASPDGINVDEKSKKYGIMLEIKNVVSRVIDGIPKREYWIQMQLQMEVCDLNECDFLETKFVEYEDMEDYQNDSVEGEKSYSKTKDEKIKGIIIYFAKQDFSPYYVYKPLNFTKKEEVESWEDDMLTLYQSEPYKYTFVKYIYWKLEIISCVMVKRDKRWFENNIQMIENTWNIIEKERIEGYAHRAATKKIKKASITPEIKSIGCMLVTKLT